MYTLDVMPTPADVVRGELPNGRGQGVVRGAGRNDSLAVGFKIHS